MKKIVKGILLLLMSFSLCAPFAGCVGGSDTMRIMLDSNVFVGDFADIDEAIESYRMSMDNGTEPDTVYNRKKLENTGYLKDFVTEKGITIEAQALGWGEPLTRSLLNCFLVADGPDLVIGETQLPTFAKQGYLRPFPDDLAQYIRDNCSPLAYRAMELDGKIYGVSLCPGIAVLAWNKEILIRAGYAETDPIVTEGPASWEEWEEAMQTVYSALNKDRVYAGGIYAGGNTGGYMRVGALLNSAGGSYDAEDGTPAIDTQANRDAFDFVRRMRDMNKDGICNAYDEATYFSAYNKGQIAYKIDGTWAICEDREAGIEAGYSLIPPQEEGSGQGSLIIGATYMSVPTYAKNADIAFEMIERFLQEDIQQNIADGGLRFPVLNSIVESNEYRAEHPEFYEFAKYASENDVRGVPSFDGNISDLWTAVSNAITLTYSPGNKTPIAEILANAQGLMTEAYNAYN